MRNTRGHQAGATLIETLVALLIFAIGMVGIAGLMASAVKYQTGNEARLHVAAAVNDLAERIRVNAAGANGYNAVVGGTVVTGTGYQLTQTYAAQIGATAATYDPDCSTAVCTPAQLAAYDQAQWQNLLRATLPGGAGFITGNVINGFDVSVMWFDKSVVDGNGDLVSTISCSNTIADQDKAEARFCCPSQASVPAGVRCYTAKVIP
jgi:type IV pilus assembly protein PilV